MIDLASATPSFGSKSGNGFVLFMASVLIVGGIYLYMRYIENNPKSISEIKNMQLDEEKEETVIVKEKKDSNPVDEKSTKK